MMEQRLLVTASPHIRDAVSTRYLMGSVCLALVPTLFAATLIFGVRALVLTAVTVLSCVAMEYIWCVFTRRPVSVGDLSAVVTGLLLAFNLPATVPLWIAMIGAFVAIIIVKMMFGGIGCNFANPAIVARIVLATGFTARMSDYVFPATGVDAFSAATPLAVAQAPGSESYLTLLLGAHGGALGETCALTLLIGGVYLMVARVVHPAIPVSYLATVAVFSLLCGQDPIYQLLSGGLLLGAFFMATDYVTSPYTTWGKILYGVGLGLLTGLIRFFGNSPEGVSYAILLMNILTPHLNRLTRQRPLGGGRA